MSHSLARVSTCTLVLLICSIAGIAQKPQPLNALPLSPTPLMGWGTWNHYGKTVTEADVRANADALVSLGLKDLGYNFVNVDGSWEGERDANGVLQPNTKKFPDMKALGTYLHSKGLKYGVYSSPGPLTCGGFVASYGHEQQDANTFADWGADYLKYDLCSLRVMMKTAEMDGDHAKSTAVQIAAYDKMQHALMETGRPIYYALCQYGIDYVQEWAPKVGATMYRTTNDIKANWESMTQIGFAQAGLAKYQSPGHFLDPDSLEIGNGTLRQDENRLHFSLWSMVAAPLILGNDLTTMDKETLEIISNKEVIAVDQDPMAKAGDRVWALGELELWARPLSGGRTAVALFNRTNGVNTMTMKLSDVGWSGPAKVRDLWAHKNLPVITDKLTVDVPRHGVVMVVLQK
jgi:alpha-galactosidase